MPTMTRSSPVALGGGTANVLIAWPVRGSIMARLGRSLARRQAYPPPNTRSSDRPAIGVVCMAMVCGLRLAMVSCEPVTQILPAAAQIDAV